MSVPNSLLAILAAEPAHGYGLKSRFESRTAGAWPLNAGQVYSTLARLERDGLIEAGESIGDRRPWRITERGREALTGWYGAPVDDRAARDELVIKVLVALAAGDEEMGRVIQTQRSATMTRLQEYARHKMEIDEQGELPRLLVLDALMLRAEAEIRWLDRCEERLAGERAGGAAGGAR